MGSTADETVASMPGRRGASWLGRQSYVQQQVNLDLGGAFTHLQSRMSCSKATKVFHMISYKFCSSTVSLVARSVGKGGTILELLAWLDPLADLALACFAAFAVVLERAEAIFEVPARLLPGDVPGMRMGEACA